MPTASPSSRTVASPSSAVTQSSWPRVAPTPSCGMPGTASGRAQRRQAPRRRDRQAGVSRSDRPVRDADLGLLAAPDPAAPTADAASSAPEAHLAARMSAGRHRQAAALQRHRPGKVLFRPSERFLPLLLGERETPRSPRFYDQRPWAKATMRRRRSSAPTAAAAAASSLTTSTQRASALGARAPVKADHYPVRV